MNFNTVFFQVRSNGTVIYPSKIETFSPYFKGKPDEFPDYDPLAFAVKTAHSLGLEIHAWVNVFRCFSGKDNQLLNYPQHIAVQHKNWIVEYFNEGKKSYWLDPGLPEVRNYLISLLKEMVENYKIDGINLDYLRYPGRFFDDSFSYSAYGQGKPKAAWRRQNIINFLTRAYKELKKINPLIKIGVSPIGVYKDESNASLTGYYDVFQDSYDFLKNKIVDYISPQIYWALEGTPKFEPVAKGWIEHSNGRNVVPAIALYKKAVASEVPEIIKTLRKLNADGVAFYRYDYLDKINFNGFKHFTYPAEMSWIKLPDVLPPVNFKAQVIKTFPLETKFTWQNNPKNSKFVTPQYYSLFVKNGNDLNLITMVPAQKKSLNLTIKYPSKTEYTFVIKSVNKLWNESKDFSSVTVRNKFLSEVISLHNFGRAPMLFEHSGKMILSMTANQQEQIEIILKDDSKGRVLNSNLEKGRNFIPLPSLKKPLTVEIKFKKGSKVFRLKIR